MTHRQLWEILVPAEINGKPVPVDYHKEWDEMVLDIAGGLTILRSAKGRWLSENGLSIGEGVIPVRIACTETELYEIIEITAKHYFQVEVFSYLISSAVCTYMDVEERKKEQEMERKVAKEMKESMESMKK